MSFLSSADSRSITLFSFKILRSFSESPFILRSYSCSTLYAVPEESITCCSWPLSALSSVSSNCDFVRSSSTCFFLCSSSSAKRSFSSPISFSWRQSSSSRLSSPPSVDMIWPSSMLAASICLIIWLRSTFLAASSLLADDSSMLCSLDASFAVEGSNNDSLRRHFSSSIASKSRFYYSAWLSNVSCASDLSFILADSLSLRILFSTLSMLSSSLTRSASPALMRSAICWSCAFFSSIVLESLASISRRFSTESPRSIALVRSDILLPKSSDIDPPAGSNSSPSTETARKPCLASAYALDEFLIRMVSENRNDGSLPYSEYTKSERLPMTLTSS